MLGLDWAGSLRRWEMQLPGKSQQLGSLSAKEKERGCWGEALGGSPGGIPTTEAGHLNSSWMMSRALIASGGKHPLRGDSENGSQKSFDQPCTSALFLTRGRG